MKDKEQRLRIAVGMEGGIVQWVISDQRVKADVFIIDMDPEDCGSKHPSLKTITPIADAPFIAFVSKFKPSVFRQWFSKNKDPLDKTV